MENQTQQATPTSTGSLDTQVVNLAKSIRRVESNDNFQAEGKSGEYGAYQFTEPTWANYSKRHGVTVPLKQASREQQNEVVYKQLKQWKDKGYNPGQIASMWNAGEGRPNAYKENFKGTNDYGVSYDVPLYAEKVAKQYQSMKGQSPIESPATSPYKTQPVFSQTAPTAPPMEKPEESLGAKLKERGSTISNNVSGFLNDNVSFPRAALRTAGALGGAVGDIAGSAISAITPDKIEKPIKGLIEKGVGKLIETKPGEKIVQGISNFAQKHPEAAKDIGAVVDFASALPILKGVGVAKDVVLDAGSLALKKLAEKAATKDLTATVSRTISGRNAIKREGGDTVKRLIAERAIPDIEDGKYTTKEAFQKLSDRISDIEENKLQVALAKADRPDVASRIPLDDYKKEAIAMAEDELKDPASIEAYFNRLQKKYGSYPTLRQMNEAKRIVAKNISEAGFNSPNYSADKIVRSALQKAVEDGATALKLGDVNAINKEMAQLIKAQNILSYIEGKPVKSGLIGETVKNAATFGGEMAGGATGIPIAGTLAGRQAGGWVGKKIKGMKTGILNRTGKDAERVTGKEFRRKTAGMFGALGAQEITSRQNQN